MITHPRAHLQIAGFVARCIVSYLREGDRKGRGERFGLIRFGSRVDLYLPPGTKVDVSKGQKVLGGLSIVGRFA